MISLGEAVGAWLFPPDSKGAVPRRALFLGAGFTRSCWAGAPNFDDLKGELKERLRAAGVAEIEGLDAETSDLVELLDHRAGRVGVARAVLAEPLGRLRLYPALDPVWRPPSPRAPSTFRSLRQWKEALEASSPTHLDPLRPDGAALMLGRLVAEEAVDEILTTNWDAYVELGCFLAGVRVCDADEQADDKPEWLRALDRRLWVYENPRDAAFRPRPHDGTVLLKLHGGIRSLQRILSELLHARVRTEEAEAELRSSFLVATEDLIHWEIPSQWVADAAADALRSHSVLTIGLSGSDPVLYRAFRSRIREWEASRPPNEHAGARPLPALAGTDKDPKARTLNMLTLDERRGLPAVRLARSGGAEVLRSVYARWLLEERLLVNEGSNGWPAELGRRLRERLRGEIESLPGPDAAGSVKSPLVDLLCDSLGPGACWAAIAELRVPFGRIAGPSEVLRRWRYAPWPRESPPDHLREIVSFLALVGEESVEVDPWTGLVWLPPGRLLERLRELGAVKASPSGGASLLPLPWPWRPSWGLDAPWLWHELSDRLQWGPGIGLERLARAPVSLVPLPALPIGCRRSARLGGVRASVFGKFDRSPSTDFWCSLARDCLGLRGDR